VKRVGKRIKKAFSDKKIQFNFIQSELNLYATIIIQCNKTVAGNVNF